LEAILVFQRPESLGPTGIDKGVSGIPHAEEHETSDNRLSSLFLV
jgi:hypothetical protein